MIYLFLLLHIFCKNSKSFSHIFLFLNLPPNFCAKETFLVICQHQMHLKNWCNFYKPLVWLSCPMENYSFARNFLLGTIGLPSGLCCSAVSFYGWVLTEIQKAVVDPVSHRQWRAALLAWGNQTGDNPSLSCFCSPGNSWHHHHCLFCRALWSCWSKEVEMKQKKCHSFLGSYSMALLHVGTHIRLPTARQWILIGTPSNKIVGKRLRTGCGVPICGGVPKNSFLLC